jgi:tryptophanyl-tRNA synthetase
MNTQNPILSKKRIVSGITPSGDGALHIGNYLGAVKQFIEIAKNNECFLFVADLHALTTVQDKQMLERNKQTLILNELSLLAGFGTMDHIIFFDQSELPHAELQCIINNVTPLGLLKRAHAYKDKLGKDVMEDDINMGLFNYPILMAADILMYKPDFVPVGKDQKQHIEITRDIAERFNRTYKTKTFKLPEPYIPEEVATVLGTDGKRKMSKSLGNIISIFEDEKTIHKQVMGCYTDPTRAKATDPGHVEGNMVFAYLDHFGEKGRVSELKKLYTEGKIPDVEVKEELYSTLMRTFAPAREKYKELVAKPEIVRGILNGGREKAMAVAAKTMGEVRDAIGLKTQYSFVQTNVQNTNDLSPQSTSVTIDEFSRMEIRVGHVTNATHPEKSEKLIRLEVDFGETVGKRIIFTGVRGYGYTKDDFIDKKFLFIVNLLPRKMMGEESQGMILAVDGTEESFGVHGDAKPIFVDASAMPVGAKIR